MKKICILVAMTVLTWVFIIGNSYMNWENARITDFKEKYNVSMDSLELTGDAKLYLYELAFTDKKTTEEIKANVLFDDRNLFVRVYYPSYELDLIEGLGKDTGKFIVLSNSTMLGTTDSLLTFNKEDPSKIDFGVIETMINNLVPTNDGVKFFKSKGIILADNGETFADIFSERYKIPVILGFCLTIMFIAYYIVDKIEEDSEMLLELKREEI